MNTLKFYLLLSLSIFFISCGDISKKVDDKIDNLINQKETLDSILKKETEKVTNLDSIIKSEHQKVMQFDSLIQKSSTKVDSMTNIITKSLNK